MKTKLLLLSIPILIASCTNDTSVLDNLDVELQDAIAQNPHVDGIESLKMPSSDDFGAIPQDPRNRLTREKIELGKLLFHETALGQEAKMEEGFLLIHAHHVTMQMPDFRQEWLRV